MTSRAATPLTADGPTKQDALPLALVTGAAGRVGRLTVGALAGRYRLRLVELDWPAALTDDASVAVKQADRVAADLRDPERWPALLNGVDSVVHLAGNPSPEISAREAVEDVAMATAHLVSAAAAAGVRRIVYASSIHAMGLYQRHGNHPIDPRWPPQPCCDYGAAKVLSENLLALLVQRSTVSVVSLRLGMTGVLPSNEFQASHWLGDGDCAELMRCAITAEVSCGAYFGMSNGGSGFWDLSPTTADLGFIPAQFPLAPDEPEPEPAGHCLMPG